MLTDSLCHFLSYVYVKQSSYDRQLYLLRDLGIVELDESLLHLNLFDSSGGGGDSHNGGGYPTASLWKFVSDAQRDPYTTALSTFSKIAEKLVFSPVDDDRPEDEVAELLHRSFVTPSTLDVTTSNTGDGEEFEVVTARYVCVSVCVIVYMECWGKDKII